MKLTAIKEVYSPVLSLLLLLMLSSLYPGKSHAFPGYKQINICDTVPVADTGLKVFEKVEIEAAFPGGETGWRSYLEQNLNANTPVDHGAPAGKYEVWVQFIVDKEGNISNITALTKNGFGMEAEVMRIIRKSPQWMPAEQDGRKVKAYRKQPVTFVVIDERKKRRKRD